MRNLSKCDGMNCGYEIQNFGEDQINIVWIMKILDEVGYNGEIALEYEYEMHNVHAEKAIKNFIQILFLY